MAHPKCLSAVRKTATGGIATSIRKGNALLRGMDKLIGNFSAAQPEFAATWSNVRNAVHAGTRHRKEKGQQ